MGSSELVFESADAETNLARFHSLQASEPRIEDFYGRARELQELPNRKSTRVAEYLPDADVTIRE
jgi:hypothetical protein